MSETTNKSQNRRRKPRQQDTQLNQQDGLLQESSSMGTNYVTQNQKEEKNMEKSDKSSEDTKNENRNNEPKPNAFLVTIARRIMNRLYELYGYSIKDDTGRRIIEAARAYASTRNIKIQDNIQEINITELYGNILNILSLGYLSSPLDNNYNDILLRAIIDKYKVQV
jgi:ATPase subunit of ABC transporter with duplicated ATPase domains